MPADIPGDRRLMALADGALADAAARVGDHLACRIGCTDCCLGPFPITRLDALRLSRALTAMAENEPERAARIRQRAREARDAMRESFPGDPETGLLGMDEAAEKAFSTAFETTPCPVLDPYTGRCELYEARPISCRTFGPLVQIGRSALPPCRLCFIGASTEEVEAARVVVDSEGLEDLILRDLETTGVTGETIIAFALPDRDEVRFRPIPG